jgi:hypothetical protein
MTLLAISFEFVASESISARPTAAALPFWMSGSF